MTDQEGDGSPGKRRLSRAQRVDPDSLDAADQNLYRWMAMSGSDLCTEAGFVFRIRHKMVHDFFLFVGFLAQETDKKRLHLARALVETGDEDSVKLLEQVEKNKTPTMAQLRTFNNYQREIQVIRIADNFQCFLSDLIQLCMKKQPNLLKSGETITIEEVMNFTRIREMTKYLVDRKLRWLNNGGLDNVLSYLSKNLGIDPQLSGDELAKLKISIELRNIYTHNRGRIDRTFVSRVGKARWKKMTEGSVFHPEFDEIADLAANMQRVALLLDGAASKKFSLPRKRVRTWAKIGAIGH